MSLRVSPFEGNPGDWDVVARSAPGGTFCHAWGWRELIANVFGHECVYLAATDDTGVRGILPLVRLRSRLFGHYLVSMPFLNYGGPVGDPDAVGALARRAVELADQYGIDLLELRNTSEQPVDLPVSHRKITVTLAVPSEGAPALWKGLRSKVCSQVRRPQKGGRGSPVRPRRGRAVLCRLLPPHERPWDPHPAVRPLRGHRDHFSGLRMVRVRLSGGVPVAAGCGFRWGGEFEMTWASALREHARLAPKMLLYWAFLERCAEHGVREFNFGRCTPGSGTHRFKLQMGRQDQPLWWYHVARGSVGRTPSPDDGRYAWGPRLWRRLPVPVTTALGPRIVRYIS